jgi:hypothetical protein
MKKIPLSRGLFAIVDDEDYERITSVKRKWHAVKSRNTFYAQRNKNSSDDKLYIMHRAIINPPDDMIVDHINGNGLDNRKSNLRIASKEQNALNRGNNKNNTSGRKGVEFDNRNNKWRASIRYKNKLIHLGSYSLIEDAIHERERAEKLYFGEFARK